MIACEILSMVNSLKDPRGDVPPELWSGFEKELGPFPNRVGELIKALSGDVFPSFQELLKIFCGGNLRQACSFCSTRVDVDAVEGEVLGCYEGIPTVSIFPFLPPLFCCGANTCKVEEERKEDAFLQLHLGLGATRGKLRPTRCDYCFLLAEKVHRCSKCLTKNYCSRACLLKDSDEKHSKFCHKGEEKRKVKGDAQARLEGGLRQLEIGLEESLKGSGVPKNKLVEVKELCEKQGVTGKMKSEGGNSKKGRGKK